MGYAQALRSLFESSADTAQQALELLETLDDRDLERELLAACEVSGGRLVPSPLFDVKKRPDLTQALIVLFSRTPLAQSLTALTLDGEPLDALPAEIGRFTQLRSLGLRGTGVAELPDTLWSLALEELDVSGTRLAHLDGVERLRGLVSLSMGTGDPWGRRAPLQRLPDLGGLPLRRLAVVREGKVPDLGALDQLQELDLSDNLLDELPALPEGVQRLTAAGNRLGRFPRAALELELTALDLSRCQFHTLPKAIAQLWQLKRLNLSNGRVKVVPDEVAYLRRLEVLDLSGTRVPKARIDALRRKLPNCWVVG